MPDDRKQTAWKLAQELARSGKFKTASHVEGELRGLGYSAEVIRGVTSGSATGWISSAAMLRSQVHNHGVLLLLTVPAHAQSRPRHRSSCCFRARASLRSFAIRFALL
jgi:hypothetical protein